MHGGNIVLSDASVTRLEKLERSAGLFNGLYPPNYLEELRRDEP